MKKYSNPPNQPITANQAVALYYDGETAPIISATGEDDLAKAIIGTARSREIPIYENPLLVQQLAQLELGEEIPELLYRVIAEIIAFVYQLEGKTPDSKPS